MFKNISIISLISLPLFSNAAEGINKIVNEKLSLEVIRQKVDVRIIITSENIKRYESIAIERAELVEGPYRQVKLFLKERINKCTDNSILDYDNYPLAVKHGGYYRVRTEEASGVMRIFPGVQLIGILQEAQMSAGNFTETNTGTKNASTTTVTSKPRTSDASSSKRDIEEISEGMKIDGDKSQDIFEKVKFNTESNDLTASLENEGIPSHSRVITSKFKSKNSRDIIELTGGSISIEDSKDTDEPMYSNKNINGESAYIEYVLTGVTEENTSSKAYRNFMKENLIKSPDITFDIAIENGSLGSEIKLDAIEKYHEVTIEYSDNKDNGFNPLKKFASAFINEKFVDNKYTIIEPFYAPKGKKQLYFRMRIKEIDGNEAVTKAIKVTFP